MYTDWNNISTCFDPLFIQWSKRKEKSFLSFQFQNKILTLFNQMSITDYFHRAPVCCKASSVPYLVLTELRLSVEGEGPTRLVGWSVGVAIQRLVGWSVSWALRRFPLEGWRWWRSPLEFEVVAIVGCFLLWLLRLLWLIKRSARNMVPRHKLAPKMMEISRVSDLGT